jgi:hypothetical protein
MKFEADTLGKKVVIKQKNKQEGHDGPEVAHLYIGPPPPPPGQFLPKGFYLFI